MSTVTVRRVDGEWRAWVPVGSTMPGTPTHLADAVYHFRGGRSIVAYGDMQGLEEVVAVLASPGLPCQIEGLDEMREALEAARDALEHLPVDCLGEAGCVVELPSGEDGVQRWPIRDELIDKITKALR